MHTTKMSVIPRTRLTPSHEISRVIKGGWQLSGDHGPTDTETADRDMAAFVEAGLQRDAVKAVIVGATNASHLDSNARIATAGTAAS